MNNKYIIPKNFSWRLFYKIYDLNNILRWNINFYKCSIFFSKVLVLKHFIYLWAITIIIVFWNTIPLSIIDIILCYFWFASWYSFWIYYLLNYLPFFGDPSRTYPMYRYIMLAGRLCICFEKTLKGKPFGEFFLPLLLFVLILHSFCVSCTWNVSLFSHRFSLFHIFIFYLISSAWYLIIHYRTSPFRSTRKNMKRKVSRRKPTTPPPTRYIILSNYFSSRVFYLLMLTTDVSPLIKKKKKKKYHDISDFDSSG